MFKVPKTHNVSPYTIAVGPLGGLANHHMFSSNNRGPRPSIRPAGNLLPSHIDRYPRAGLGTVQQQAFHHFGHRGPMHDDLYRPGSAANLIRDN